MRTSPAILCATLIASAALLAACSPGADEDATAKPAAPTQGDPAAGRALAQACNACHSEDGNAVKPDTPLLAGQHESYLTKALRAYQDGSRGEQTMQHIRAPLSETDILHLAAFYASLPGQWGAGSAGEPGDAATAKPVQDPIDLGASAAAACGGCHGPDGNSLTPGMPNLSGQHPVYMTAAISAYASGTREDALMASMVTALTPSDLENLALFYAVQEPKPSAAAATGNAVAGAALAASCGGCHGAEGVSAAEDTPSLAGQDPQYLVKATAAYRDGQRAHEVMQGAVAGLDDQALQDIAAFYVAKPPAQASFRRPLPAAEWATRCDRCHGEGGLGDAATGVPRLAGQKLDYLRQALGGYESGARKSGSMHAMSAPLSAGEREALALYYANR